MAKKQVKKKVSRVNLTNIEAKEIVDLIESADKTDKTKDKPTDYSQISKGYVESIQGKTGRPKKPETANRVRYTTNIDKDILRVLRVIAADIDLSANELIEKLTLDYISTHIDKYDAIIPDNIREKIN